MDRALPARFIDLIHDGVPERDLNIRGDPAIFGVLVSTAMSARQRGWCYPDWANVVTDPRRRLANQLQVKSGKPRGRKRVEALLAKAWAAAGENIERFPRFGRRELAVEAARRAEQMTNAISDADLDISDAMRKVLASVVDLTSSRGALQTAISDREFLARTGLGLTALRTAIRRLDQAGLLLLVEKGKPSGPGAKKRRANVWSLPARLPTVAASPNPVNGVVMPSSFSSDAPVESVPDASALSSNAPSHERTMPVIPLVRTPDGSITITIPEDQLPSVLNALVSAVTAEVERDSNTVVDLCEPSSNRDRDPNVTPIRHRHERRAQ